MGRTSANPRVQRLLPHSDRSLVIHPRGYDPRKERVEQCSGIFMQKVAELNFRKNQGRKVASTGPLSRVFSASQSVSID
jgi:hypothetical protein